MWNELRKRKMKENIEDRERKISFNQVLINSKVRDSRDHRVPGSLQLRPPVKRLFYRCRQLQVHNEVTLEDKTFLVVPIVEESTRDIIGE